ncbi:hypothetical protein JCGZ_23522 [Jatropha curcas]|uniref:F-box domain-containing protein n=1 Tax=Jatropha curcas TaxID=180498 RepID=A0A067JVZ4_JATCU|nr:hypothetical protein JCGZ_23522 [Jatropha curcas]
MRGKKLEISGSCLSELPQEILAQIAESLDNYLDYFRFGAVCKSFRSSVHGFNFQYNSDYRSLKLPLIYFREESLPGYTTIDLKTFYLLRHSPSSESCLVKVQAYPQAKNRLLLPLLDPKTRPLELNLIDFSVSELHKHYFATMYELTGDDEFYSEDTVSKIVVIGRKDELAAMAIYGLEVELAWIRLGDERWTAMNEQDYDDIINYKGQFYAVQGGSGKLIKIDVSSSKAMKVVVPNLLNGSCGCSSEKNLVESGGELLLLDRDMKGNKLRVYKANEEEGKWVEIKSLGDRTVVVKEWRWAFSVCARDLGGSCKSNCVLYVGKDGFEMFNLDDGSYSVLHSTDFPPIFKWLGKN